MPSDNTCEWWVMRVWTRWVDGTRYVVRFDDCSAGVQIAVGAAYALGKLAFLPDASGEGALIAEPIEVFDGIEGQVNAHAYADAKRKQHPLEDFRVVMNVDI